MRSKRFLPCNVMRVNRSANRASCNIKMYLTRITPLIRHFNDPICLRLKQIWRHQWYIGSLLWDENRL